MIVRALDSDGDWTFGNGKSNYKKNINAVKQCILTKLRSWKGNCFFDINSGVDYNSYLDIGTKSLLDLDIKKVILQTDNVLKITSFTSTLDRETRSLTIEAKIESYYGTITLEDEIS